MGIFLPRYSPLAITLLLAGNLLEAADPDGAIYEKARQLEIERRWAEAAQVWESAKDDPIALSRAGTDWEVAGQSARAEHAYSSILKHYPNSTEVGPARFALALIAQGKNDFAKMEAYLLWFLHNPEQTIRRPEALALLGAHYLVTRGDRWAAYGCFETLRIDYPSHTSLKMAVSSWAQIEEVGDLTLWSSVQARWKSTGLLPDRIPLFLLKHDELKRLRTPSD